MVQFQFESKGLRTKRIDGVSSSLKAARCKTTEKPMFLFKPKGKKKKKKQSPSSKSVRHSLLLRVGQPFALFKPSTGWIRPSHIRENNLLYSVY